MGLDMFLKRTKRVNGVTIGDMLGIDCAVGKSDPEKEFDPSILDLAHRKEVKEFADAVVLRGEYDYHWYSIFEEVGYWRKANQIHHWFVENVQGGKDDCQHYEVSREKLQTLLDTVNEVLLDHSRAIFLLPPRSGFFFGDTEYDEWYFKDLINTRKILEKGLLETDFEKQIVFYRSSW